MDSWNAILRDEYLGEANLQVPKVLRVIDINATCKSGAVVLRDFWEQRAAGYAAISHTYGMEVYTVFDCRCTSKFMICSERANVVPPRCSFKNPCPHETPGPLRDARNRVVNDILGMCGILRDAGVKYAWHDGVCIAQHDKDEVNATILCMGWIYSEAMETIVFLHYVGRPMAPIAPRGSSVYEPTCRWHTRVWTIQEAALSRSRRYCVRVCRNSPLALQPLADGECHDAAEYECKVKEFEDRIGLWYKEDQSTVDVILEETLNDLLDKLTSALKALQFEGERLQISSESFTCVKEWLRCVNNLSEFLSYITHENFSLYFRLGLHQGSLRESKHVGDRINSILGLAGVHGFVVPKEEPHNMESLTIEFFERVEAEDGLAVATFCVNVRLVEKIDRQYIRHSWVPALWKPLELEVDPNLQQEIGIEYSVREDKMLELRGELLSVPVRFTVKLQPDLPPFKLNDAHGTSLADLLHMQDAHQQYLSMDLTFRPQSRHIYSKATLSLAPPPHDDCCMGTAVLPIWDCEEEERCLDIGGQFVRLVDGQSFDACLVFSLRSSNPGPADRPTLIVHQPPTARACDGVFKIGMFRMSDLLFTFALASTQTPINELVLK